MAPSIISLFYNKMLICHSYLQQLQRKLMNWLAIHFVGLFLCFQEHCKPKNANVSYHLD